MAIPHLYRRIDEEVRRCIESRFSEHYPNLKITIRSAEVVEGEGIEVRGLSIVDPDAEGPGAELIHYDEAFIQCNTELKDLVSRKPKVSAIIIRRARVRVTRRPDGTWSIQKLLPLPVLSEEPPEMIIENGTVEIFDPLKSPASTLTLRDVNLTFKPPVETEQGVTIRKIQGTLAGDHLRRVGFEGHVLADNSGWSIGGIVEGLEISPDMRNSLPEPAAAKIAALGEFRGQTSLTFNVSYDQTAAVPYTYEVSGNLIRGRMDDPRFPHALTDMQARIRLNNAGAAIDGFVARCGQATLNLSARCSGLAPGAPMVVQGEIRKLGLDRKLLDILPEKLQEQWYKYLPGGEIDADVKLAYDGQSWKPEATIRCLNVSFTHHKFPYRLDQGSGTLQIKDDRLEAHLVAYSRSQPIRIDAVMHNISSGAVGWCELRGDDMQIDEKLLSALNDKAQPFVRSLNPQGTLGFHVRLERKQPHGQVYKDVNLSLNSCSIRYDKFPYPLANIRGTVEMHDDSWTFRGLQGTNDTGRVTCEGYMKSPAEGRELFMRFVGRDVPLEEELRDALKPSVQRLWSDLRPRGMVDLVADVRYFHETKKVDVALRAWPQSETASIEPTYFPYRLEKLQGEMEYRDGYVTLRRFKAEHEDVKLAANGYCDFPTGGTWHFHLENLSVDRVRLDDRELVSALPGRLKKGIAALKPVGPVNIRGTFDLEGGPEAGAPLRSKWDVALNFHNGSVDCGLKLENLNGSMTQKGAFDGKNFHSRGELALDSVTYKDYQLTQVNGPMWVDDRQALFGAWVARRQGQVKPEKPRPLTGALFGGTVYGDAWVTLGATPQYGMYATLSQGDLARCAREVVPGRQELSGKVTASVGLRGKGKSVQTLEGKGKIALRDADVYELPVMIALLKILSIRPPDQTAFTKSDIDFSIAGEHLYFDKINFNGDAISLLGQGEMDFNRAIALKFYAMVGSGDVNVPIIRDIIGGASQQALQINVGGTLDEPEVTSEVFPGVAKTLQQIEIELQKSANARQQHPQARNLMPDRGRR